MLCVRFRNRYLAHAEAFLVGEYLPTRAASKIQITTSTQLYRRGFDERALREMRLHSPFTSAALFSLSKTCLQIELLVGVDEMLQTMRSAAAAATTNTAAKAIATATTEQR